jgi:hypothetical protein
LIVAQVGVMCTGEACMAGCAGAKPAGAVMTTRTAQRSFAAMNPRNALIDAPHQQIGWVNMFSF